MTAAAGAGLGAEERAKTEAMDAAAYEWLYRRVMGNGTVHFDSDAMEADERWVRYFARQMALFATDRLAAADRDAGLRERVEALLAAVDRAARLAGTAANHPEALSIRAEAAKVRAALDAEVGS